MNIPKYFKSAVLGAFILGVNACAGTMSSFPPVHFATMPKADDYPDMPAVVLLDNATLTYKTQNGKNGAQAVLTHHRRYKILNERGFSYATIVLPTSAHSNITSLSGRIVYPDGREKALAGNEIQHQPGLVRPELGRVIARISGPEVGAVVEFQYVRTFDDARYIPTWNMGSELPVKRAEFAIITTPDILLDIRSGTGQFISDEQPIRRDLEKNQQRLLWVKNDLPPLYPEENMPDLQRLRAWVSPVFQGVRAKESGAQSGDIMRKWEDVGAWYLKETKHLTELNTAHDWISREQSETALYSWLQEQAVPVSTEYIWEAGPVDYNEIGQKKPASVRDLAAFFAAILKVRGLEAYPVLVIKPGGRLINIDMPSLVPFAHVVVAVKKQGGAADYSFLDPGCPKCGFATLPRELQGGAGLLIKDEEHAEFINLPLSTPEQNSSAIDIKMRLKNTGELEGFFNLKAEGEAARLLREALSKNKSEQKKALLAAFADSGTSMDISNWEVADLKNLSAPIRVTGACKASMKELKYQEYKFAADQITGELYHHLWKDKRRYQLATGGPLVWEMKLSIELPVGYEVDQPLPVDLFAPGYGEYSSYYKKDGKYFRFERRFVIKKPIIESEEYGEFLAFIKKARQAEALGVTFLSTEE